MRQARRGNRAQRLPAQSGDDSRRGRTYTYDCIVHPGMVGTVAVVPAGRKIATATQNALAAKQQLAAIVRAAEQA